MEKVAETTRKTRSWSKTLMTVSKMWNSSLAIIHGTVQLPSYSSH